MEGADALPSQDVICRTSFAFFEHLADAADRRQPGFQRGFQAHVHRVIGFTKILPALGVADDHMGYAKGEQHRRRRLTRVSAFRFPMDILGANRYIRAFHRFQGSRQINVRGANYDLVSVVSGEHRNKLMKEFASLVGRFVHLPVGGDQLISHEEAFSIRSRETVLERTRTSAARVYAFKVEPSNRMKRILLTCFAKARVSMVEEIATSAASATG